MGRKKSAKAPQRWWASLDEEDPITLEPISDLAEPPFKLDGSYFDARTLADYLCDSGRLENPRADRAASWAPLALRTPSR